ncbi:Methyltransferase domain-containing protein [Amphibacillus marinus]|uniref:Methyltransferase domain-containing protein n=1 Tax=Amphibacillus marinus TaxID=872970 RepID=A0A1H8MFC7_9BACI|nr:class I SAM-dependent methyltransferase [Amphibacillus marinus]SEO15964.1 Methyltransferase domain-containing protein [Amphibacillus marinus]
MSYSYTDMIAAFKIGAAHPGGTNATKKAISKMITYPHDSILDVGCGIGKTLGYLATITNSKLYGVDAHPRMIKHARAHLDQFAQVMLFHSTIAALPIKDESIDCILAESVTSFTNIHSSLKKYNQLLRPAGIACLIELTLEHELEDELHNEFCSFYGLNRLLSKDEWLTQIKAADFAITEVISLKPESGETLDIEIDNDIAPAYFELMAYHYALIEQIRPSLSSYLFVCQKKPRQPS